jgi:hypothetical protein
MSNIHEDESGEKPVMPFYTRGEKMTNLERRGQIFVFVAILTALFAMPPVLAQEIQVGVVGVVHGAAESVSPDGTVKELKAGDPVFLDEQVVTKDDGRLQILLMDETVFTLGPSSAIRLDDFAYDPVTQDGILNTDILRGVFRFISGKIAHKKPENMSVGLPAGSIGIRGTVVAGRSEGFRSLVVLLGPAGDDVTPPGRIFVSNDIGGARAGVEISQIGFGTVIEGPGTTPAPVFRVPEADLNGLMDELNLSSNGYAATVPNAATFGASAKDIDDMTRTLSLMSQMEEYGHRATQGGMMSLPQPVMPGAPAAGRGSDDGSDSGNSSSGG